MPTYEYACTSCGEHLEVMQSFKDDPLTECPACGGDLRKVFAPIGVVFKGSGFYKNDSRSSNKSTKSSNSDGATSTADTSSTPPASKPAGGESGASKSDSTAPSKPAPTGSGSTAAAAS